VVRRAISRTRTNAFAARHATGRGRRPVCRQQHFSCYVLSCVCLRSLSTIFLALPRRVVLNVAAEPIAESSPIYYYRQRVIRSFVRSHREECVKEGKDCRRDR